MNALAIAAAVREGRLRAVEAVGEALARINRHDGTVNAFVRHRGEQALREAAALDAARARGEPLPPLAGVPFAVKDNFDLRGEVTTAGSRVNLGRTPAAADALVVQRLRAAGAIPVGATNMDAYAYGFTTENSDFGATFNPRDLARTAGGSSGGSAAAVAAGMVPLALGTDTNGSVRVPAALCGVFGLKPTYGRLPRSGTFAFVHGLDHLGCFARGVADLTACYDAMQGGDASDPACDPRAAQPAGAQLALGVQGLRLARLGGYFEQWADDSGARGLRLAEKHLGELPVAQVPHTELARASAFLITAAEGGALHGRTVRAHYDRFEPHSRDRFLAGALTPAAWYLRAQRFRSWFRHQLEGLFEQFDVLLAPATPVTATLLGQERMDVNGIALPLRPSMGLLTQPISFAGLPVAVAPVAGPGQAPSGVQIIAAPWREDLCLRVAAHLENAAVASAPIAEGFA
ncbi:MAG: AtzE family amidohydrolase [Rhodocyclaceae bacterium]|jgi:AtzE family amidohydrolase|nr:AtzE family amidohydrolase [Rhodocyclaceae bacterium]MCA3134694.1 AtzE family amidohydrolase [Rhodocyclaceae bacterium]MCA3143812.1 AtzE family amidohydrolase [Rhodocyclaceae bacterium]MCA3147444.1 AtzE family amidohydrolase [Rhodocyclaceae bacterium]